MKEIVNLNLHPIVVEDKDGVRHTFAPSGLVARVAQVTEVTHMLNKTLPVGRSIYGNIEGLPPRQYEKVYIVSGLVLNALRGIGDMREDVVAPRTDNTAIREGGNVVAVRGFLA